MLNVTEINADGLATRSARFQNEDLKAAHDCLNQWWIESLPPELAAVAAAGVAFIQSMTDGDGPALTQQLRGDFELTDRRSMRPARLGRREAIDMWLTRQESTRGFTILGSAIDRLTPNGSVSSVSAVTPAGFVTDSIQIQIMKDGQFSRMEAFETGDLDQALARFDELTSTSPS